MTKLLTVGLTFALSLGACSKQEINPAWLAEQTALVDKTCACTDPLKSKEDLSNEAYFAKLADVQRCLSSMGVINVLVYKSPSGVSPGVDPDELWEDGTVNALNARFFACQDELSDRLKSLNQQDRVKILTAK